jgi:NAD(P)-dependent dehydrogenase (short-subunit alcohol dehydrogenase family)
MGVTVMGDAVAREADVQYVGPVGGTAIVTGGSRGIGAATARLLAARGWDVAISYRQDSDAAAAVVAGCEAAGVSALAVQGDVASERDVERLFSAVDERLGSLGALVNNAGIVAETSRVDGLTRDRIERLLAVNVIGPFLCAREAVRHMSTSYGGAGGVIVNVSSAASRLGSAGEYVDYAASKGAIDTMTIGLAAEVAREAIRVNAIRVGVVRTDIHARAGQPDRLERTASLIPIGRPGLPEEIASAIAWLCSEEASYVTGAILDVSGGR